MKKDIIFIGRKEEGHAYMKTEPAVPVTARVKLQLYTSERFFGPGICELLEKIRETGSIQAAAAKMGMSYTKAWKILNRAEREMGVHLIHRQSGGKNGGSSTLSEAGEKVVAGYREMEKCLSETADALLKEYVAVFNLQVPKEL